MIAIFITFHRRIVNKVAETSNDVAVISNDVVTASFWGRRSRDVIWRSVAIVSAVPL